MTKNREEHYNFKNLKMLPFKELRWFSDRMIFRDFVFRLEHYKNDNWELGEGCFIFFKIKELVDEYEDFFRKQTGFKANNLFELGIYGGGSIAFWNELLNPEKHIAIDISKKNENRYLTNYFEKKKSAKKIIQTFGGVNQSDKKKLLELYQSIFNTPLDLVIDDASHMYTHTKTSFETLFPLLRPEGLYIIEDWAWGHWEEFFAPNHDWAREIPPTKLINELVELAGTDNSIIKSLTIYRGFTVVERGLSTNIDENFTLEKFIKRRPNHPDKISLYNKLKKNAKRVLGR